MVCLPGFFLFISNHFLIVNFSKWNDEREREREKLKEKFSFSFSFLKEETKNLHIIFFDYKTRTSTSFERSFVAIHFGGTRRRCRHPGRLLR
jgi:hypothetical protein